MPLCAARVRGRRRRAARRRMRRGIEDLRARGNERKAAKGLIRVIGVVIGLGVGMMTDG